MINDKYIAKPRALIQDKRLTPLEADYLCLIAQLQKANGCTAGNNYFATYFGVSRPRAVGVITSLKNKKFITTTEERQGGMTLERTIQIIDADSKKALLSNSKESLQGIVRKSDFDSKESMTHTIENTIENTLASFLFSQILNRKPDFKKPDLQKWANHIDKMIRLDQRKPERIEAVIKFCQQDDFWQDNILSAETLRKQFDKLELKMQKNNPAKPEPQMRILRAE